MKLMEGSLRVYLTLTNIAQDLKVNCNAKKVQALKKKQVFYTYPSGHPTHHMISLEEQT